MCSYKVILAFDYLCTADEGRIRDYVKSKHKALSAHEKLLIMSSGVLCLALQYKGNEKVRPLHIAYKMQAEKTRGNQSLVSAKVELTLFLGPRLAGLNHWSFCKIQCCGDSHGRSAAAN